MFADFIQLVVHGPHPTPELLLSDSRKQRNKRVVLWVNCFAVQLYILSRFKDYFILNMNFFSAFINNIWLRNKFLFRFNKILFWLMRTPCLFSRHISNAFNVDYTQYVGLLSQAALAQNRGIYAPQNQQQCYHAMSVMNFMFP